jgi:hypothetical protein
MVGIDLKDQSDHKVDSQQIWLRESEPWKNILLQFSGYIQNGRFGPHGMTSIVIPSLRCHSDPKEGVQFG